MATTVANTPMQTFMVSIDPKDKRAVKLVELLKLLDFFKVEEIPSDSNCGKLKA